MKSVLISIQPKWCELIAIGKKTVEVRKTRPKIETPFKVYIYCTKNKEKRIGHWLSLYCDSGQVSTDIKLEDACYQLNGKVIGEFVCDRIERIRKRGVHENFDYCYCSLNVFGNDDIAIEITDIEKSCISQEELNNYGLYSHCLYAWHISDLVIYDIPKELNEFKKINRDCWYADLGLAKRDCPECQNKGCFIQRPPQSWCYVDVPDTNVGEKGR